MSIENYYSAFLKALLEGDRLTCLSLVQQMIIAEFSFIDIYENIFKKSLYEIGYLWEINQISVATEHLATAIIEVLTNQLLPTILPTQYKSKKIIFTAIEGEEHRIGAKMVCDVFEKHGWHSFFLGANTPTADLITMIEQLHPNCVGLSMSIFFNLSKLKETIYAIRLRFPEMHIVVGGQGFLHGGDCILNEFSNIRLFKSLYDVEQAILKGELDKF